MGTISVTNAVRLDVNQLVSFQLSCALALDLSLSCRHDQCDDCSETGCESVGVDLAQLRAGIGFVTIVWAQSSVPTAVRLDVDQLILFQLSCAAARWRWIWHCRVGTISVPTAVGLDVDQLEPFQLSRALALDLALSCGHDQVCRLQ